MSFARSLYTDILSFQNKIVFISGPRQAGKTFLVEHFLKPTLVLNMDSPKDRLFFKKFPESLLAWFHSQPTFKKPPLVFIDEIHKVRGWRNLIKAAYDKSQAQIKYVASGSSAFELRKQDKGDSLAGRAVWFQLWPLSFREYFQFLHPKLSLPAPWLGEGSLVEKIRSLIPLKKQLRHAWEIYSSFGSFPEPLFQKNETFSEKWLEDYVAALLDRDLKDLNTGKDVERVYQVFQLLMEGLGSTYSTHSLSQTLGVSFHTVKSDILALKQVLWGFELNVASLRQARQIQKEKKFYPVDFSLTLRPQTPPDAGRFETQVACLLRRGLSSVINKNLQKLNLGFYRDYQKREVDFVIYDSKKIRAAIECKLSDEKDIKNLLSLSQEKQVEEMILVVEKPDVFENWGKGYSVSVEFLAVCLK